MQRLHNLKELIGSIDPLILFLGAIFGFLTGVKSSSLTLIFPLLATTMCLFWIRKAGRKGYLTFGVAFLLFLALALLCLYIPLDGMKEFKGVVVSSKNNYYILSDGFRRVYVYEKECLKEVGDIVSLKGKTYLYEGKEYESRFSFAAYLHDNGVRYSFYVTEESYILKLPIRWRELQLSFLSNFNYSTSKLMDMLLFGRKDYSSYGVQETTYLGLASILSSSGMLYSLWTRLFQKLLFLKLDERKSYLWATGFGILIFPFFLTKVGAKRVLINRLLSSCFLLKGKEKPIFPRLSAAGGLILASLNPFIVSSEGFLLGYFFSFFIYFSSSQFKDLKIMKRRVCSFFLRVVLFLPYFVIGGELKLFAPFYSLFFLPFSFLFSFIGYISFLSIPFVRLLNALSSFLASSIDFISKIELSVPLIPIGEELKWAYYILISLIFYFHELGLSGFLKSIVSSALCLFSYLALPMETGFSKEVAFINVGQGDSILIRDGFNSVLIDTGGNLSFDMARDVLIPFFRKEHVYKLDAVIASHSDFDHIGALDSLLANFHVGKYINSPDSFPYSVGGIKLNNLNTFDWNEENDKSLVLDMDFMGKRWLFMGDASIEVEKRIMQENPALATDIIKIGHHGSKTSSSYAFLRAIDPKVAVISVGKNNSYSHPSEEVLDRLDRLRISIRRTDVEGSIIYEGWR